MTIYSGYSTSQNITYKFKIFEISDYDNFQFYRPLLSDSSVIIHVQDDNERDLEFLWICENKSYSHLPKFVFCNKCDIENTNITLEYPNSKFHQTSIEKQKALLRIFESVLKDIYVSIPFPPTFDFLERMNINPGKRFY